MTTSLITFDAAGLQQAISDAVRDAVRQAFAAEKSHPDLLSRAEARQLLHVSNTTLNAWEKRGWLVPSRAGRRVLFHRADIDRLLSSDMGRR